MTVTAFHPARSVFSTEAVDPQHGSGPDEHAAELAAELLRCSELCRIAAEILTRDGHDVPTAPTRIDGSGASGSSPGPSAPGQPLRWSVEPVSPADRPAA